MYNTSLINYIIKKIVCKFIRNKKNCFFSIKKLNIYINIYIHIYYSIRI